jgi:succinate dehydrogenase hydrophobic anchor subunit
VLLLAAALTLANLFALRRQPSLRIFLPLLLLAAIHGTFLSQQLWGSTYGIWPLLILLLAELLAFLGPLTARAQVHRWFTPALAAIISITLLVCGGFYTVSEERLSYANLPDGPAAHSAFSALAGLATPGPYLPEIDELLRYAQANIPFDDGIVLIPGEEPFYFATGRSPRFPVPFFDPTIDPYSPAEIVSLVQTHNIRWLIVKTDVQTKEDPTPDRAELLQLLMQEFTPAAHLHGYDVYRR